MQLLLLFQKRLIPPMQSQKKRKPLYSRACEMYGGPCVPPSKIFVSGIFLKKRTKKRFKNFFFGKHFRFANVF